MGTDSGATVSGMRLPGSTWTRTIQILFWAAGLHWKAHLARLKTQKKLMHNRKPMYIRSYRNIFNTKYKKLCKKVPGVCCSFLTCPSPPAEKNWTCFFGGGCVLRWLSLYAFLIVASWLTTSRRSRCPADVQSPGERCVCSAGSFLASK